MLGLLPRGTRLVACPPTTPSRVARRPRRDLVPVGDPGLRHRRRVASRATPSARTRPRWPSAAPTSGRAPRRRPVRRRSSRPGRRSSQTRRSPAASWRTTCAGKAVSGKTWYRILSVNGKSVKSLYGVTYLYAASGLFKDYVPPAFTRYTACRVNARTGPASSTTAKAVLPTDTKVLVATQVSGTSYSTTCSGKAVSGSAWYRITSVNGTSTQSLYGVSSVYAAAGLFKTTLTTTAAPTPTTHADPDPDSHARPRRRHRPRPRRPRHPTPKASTSAIGRESSTGRRSRQPARSSPS